jgi:uncharacterized Zn-binding protein involved in type VI secretion
MPAAARLNDLHTCTLFNPDGSPHVGGNIAGPGVPSVLIGSQPAAVAGPDQCICTSVVPNGIAVGSTSVFIGGNPAARLGDKTKHGGFISSGFASVNIGG